MLKILGAIKCFNCGHISGQLSAEGNGNGPMKRRFTPRPGYSGELPKPGQTLRCERCMGPVYVDDSENVFAYEAPIKLRPDANLDDLKKSA